MSRDFSSFTRRRFLQGSTAMGLLAGLDALTPAYARQVLGTDLAASAARPDVIDLTIDRKPVRIGDREARPITINGSIPGPIVRLKEGSTATIRVTNQLKEDTSIHWHGIILPTNMDGVPGISFRGIAPGETFTYQYPVRQSGTYWYHSHSGLQEQLGHAGPLIIDSAEPEPFEYDRDYVVMLTDWTFENPNAVLQHLKKGEGYYNYHKRTVGDFFHDVETMGWGSAWKKSAMWGEMRMSPRDIADVTGVTYTYLVNGMAPEANWTALFRPGERVRLRFINGSAMTYFDVRIPGLKMTVVQADGQNVKPVPVDEFRIAVAETYDVIVEPAEDKAYTIFAESMDRSGFARGTLATREGMSAAIPEQRPAPERGMAAMGMDMEGMNMSAMQMDPGKTGAMSGMSGAEATAPSAMGGMQMGKSGAGSSAMSGMNTGNSAPSTMAGMNMGKGSHVASDMSSMNTGAGQSKEWTHGPDHHGPGAAMVALHPRSRLDDPGVGLEHVNHRVLVYSDLRSRHGWPDKREPSREIELHLTGNMERYMWSFDGKKFSEVKGPIHFKYGERLRLILVNDTMMDHPIHLHGMWMELENGGGVDRPRKHTVSVKPGERLSAQITADAPGNWAFHCHLLYHMKAGMFRVVSVA